MEAATGHVATADAVDWLQEHSGEGPLVTSLPDAQEVGLTVYDWRPKFYYWGRLCIKASRGACVFIQTDRRAGGTLESKAGMLLESAPKQVPLLWHKIALRKGVGAIDLHRPTYSHILAFGTCRPGRATPDVIESGPRTWPNGTGYNVVQMVVRWLAEVAPEGPVVNPFCGQGAFIEAALDSGRDAIGCDLDPDRAQEARQRIATVSPLRLWPG